jgi:hypothetical protein
VDRARAAWIDPKRRGSTPSGGGLTLSGGALTPSSGGCGSRSCGDGGPPPSPLMTAAAWFNSEWCGSMSTLSGGTGQWLQRDLERGASTA